MSAAPSNTTPISSLPPPSFRTPDILAELHEFLRASYTRRLKFLGDPSTVRVYTPPSIQEFLARPLNYAYELAANAASNQALLRDENRLREIAVEVARWTESNERQRICKLLEDAYQHMASQRVLAWTIQRDADEPNVVHPDLFLDDSIPHLGHPFVSASLLTFIVVHTSSSQTHDAGKLLLAGYRDMAASTPELRQLSNQMLRDPRSVSERFSLLLDPIIDVYLCCPDCFELYPMETASPETLPRCTQNEFSYEKPCGAVLWHRRAGGTRPVPIAIFELQDFKLWLGRLLLRKGMEEHLEAACSRPQQDPMRSLRDGDRVYRLRYRNGSSYLPGPPTELRLLFSHSNDGWNPYFNKSLSTASSTGFWLVCNDLPDDLKYRPENVFYAGALPGKPKGTRLNPVFSLLARCLKVFWEPGVRYSRTAKCPAGRTVRVAVTPQFSDVIATRQAAGRGAATVEPFCIYCDLSIHKLEAQLDHSTWPVRDSAVVRQHAHEWKAAPSAKARQDLEKKFDSRYTALEELPYYDYVWDHAIEYLHLKENIIQRWIREWLRVRIFTGGSLKSQKYDVTEEQRPQTRDWQAALTLLRAASDETALETLRQYLNHPKRLKRVAYHLCKDHGLRYAGTKEVLAYNLVAWRRTVTADHVLPFTSQGPLPLSTAPSVASSSAASVVSGAESDAMSVASVTSTAPPSVNFSESYWALTAAEEALKDSEPWKDLSDGLVARNEPGTLKGKARKHVMVAFCKSCHVPYTKTNGSPASMDTLAARLLEFVDAHFYNPKLMEADEIDANLPHREVLTTPLMAKFRENMRKTICPAWLETVPRDWGTRAQGSMPTGAWTVLNQVHFPITLIPEWGVPTSTEREKMLLKAQMSLVKAVSIMGLRDLPRADTLIYEAVMLKHTRAKMELFKDVHLVPYDHLALHYGDIMRGFGPSVAHDGSYYERYIRHLHGFNINLKPSEIESTYMRSSGRSANLRALLLDDHAIFDKVSSLATEYRRQSTVDFRGTKLGSLMLEASVTSSADGAKVLRTSVKNVVLPSRIRKLLPGYLNTKHNTHSYGTRIQLASSGLWTKRASVRGVRYCVEDDLSKDSYITVAPASGSPIAGQITYMFIYEYNVPDGSPTSSLMLLVRTFTPLHEHERHLDAHYRAEEDGGFCCRRTSAGDEVLIDASSSFSHAAVTPIEYQGVPLLHMLPLGSLAGGMAWIGIAGDQLMT